MPGRELLHGFLGPPIEDCTSIELQPIPFWFLLFVLGPIFWVIVSRVLNQLLLQPLSPLSRLPFALEYAKLDRDKRKKFRIVVNKALASTIGFGIWIPPSIAVFAHWHEPASWIVNTSFWSTWYRYASSILVSVYSFDLIYGQPHWDTWAHHLGCITLQMILLTSTTHRSDEPDYQCWGTLYQLATCVDQGIFWGMAVYHLSNGDTMRGLRRKLTCSKIVFGNLALTVACMNALPLALTISQWEFLDVLSRILLLACHVPFLPDQFLSLIKCYQIMQHNARRVAKAQKTMHDSGDGGGEVHVDAVEKAKMDAIEGSAV